MGGGAFIAETLLNLFLLIFLYFDRVAAETGCGEKRENPTEEVDALAQIQTETGTTAGDVSRGFICLNSENFVHLRSGGPNALQSCSISAGFLGETFYSNSASLNMLGQPDKMRGVTCDRQVQLCFSVLLGPGASSNPCSDAYRGTHAFSEVEVRNVANYLKSLSERGQIAGYMDIHAYSQLWMTPWGYTKQPSRDHNELVTN